ncbi:MAG: amidohydrolase family protein [Planctomycetota bacterium]
MSTLATLIALVGAWIHPAGGGSEPFRGTLLIDGTKIVAVGPDVAVPEGAQVLDLAGKHVIPGLIDGWVQHDREQDPLYLAAGVTLVRDAGSDLSTILTHRQPAWRDPLPGPDLLVCGRVFDASPSTHPASFAVPAPGDVPRMLAELNTALIEADQSLDYLTYLDRLGVESWRALLQGARELELPLWGPVPVGGSAAEMQLLGQAGLIGLQGLLGERSDWRSIDDGELAAALAPLSAGTMAVLPDLTGWQRMLHPIDLEAAERWLQPALATTWKAGDTIWQQLGEDERAQLQSAVARQQQALVQLQAAGVRLVPGSGAPATGVLPGQGLLDELDAWVAAGLTPDQVLAAATSGAARALGVAAQRGTLEAGKLADLVVLDADPRADLHTLRDPAMVVMRGKIVDRKGLQSRLQQLAEWQAARRAADAALDDVPPPRTHEGALILSGQADTWMAHTRVSAEHFQVRILDPDRTLYATRMIFPGTGGAQPRQIHLEQILNGALLESFDLRISAVGAETIPEEALDPGTWEQWHVVQLRGARIEGTKILNIEYRENGIFLRGERAQRVFNLLDQSLLLNGLIAAKSLQTGLQFAGSFEGDEHQQAVTPWMLAIRPEDHLLQIECTGGNLAFALRANGTIDYGARQWGGSELRVIPRGDFRTYGGPGLALPADRVYLPAPAEAAPR